jgi:hypothetical protein
VLGAAILSGCHSTPSTLVPVRSYETRSEGAGWLEGRDWLAQHQDILQIEANQKPDVILLGDSLFQGFGGSGRKVESPGELGYLGYLQPMKCANYGIAGDKIENILWRILNGEVSHPAKQVFLLAGVNNLSTNSAEEIAEGIENLIKILAPRTKVTVLKLLPIVDTKRQAQADAVNTLLSEKLTLYRRDSPLARRLEFGLQ